MERLRRPHPRALATLVWLTGLSLAADAHGQGAERLRSGAVHEQYTFADGGGITSISQSALPVAFDVSLGRRASLVLSTGYMAVALQGRDSLPFTRQLSTPLDTELRLDVGVVPERVLAFVAGTVPTGRQSVREDDLSVLVALTNDAIGFSVPAFGSGGNVSAGLSVALPVGQWALGAAATAVYAFPFRPVVGSVAELLPGAELRARLGVEGRLTRRTYLRVGGSLLTRARDQLDGVASHTLGQRIIGSANLEQGLGPVLLGLYAFSVVRGAPQLEPTALGVAVLPRGNLTAVGTTATIPLGRATSVVPSIEYRVSAAAPTATGTVLERAASAMRAGLEVRRRLPADAVVSVRGEGALGETLLSGQYFGFGGYRAQVRLEVSP